MAHHFTPAELALALDVEQEEVVRNCLQTSVPIVHGRVDRSLYEAALAAEPSAELASA